jgi:ferredoxin-NADP reductase
VSQDVNISLRIKELRRESSECLSIVFEKPRGLTFEAGDWLDIRFPVPEFPVGKTYSFASAPTEPDLMISFKKGQSPFKKALANVQPGETMLITQYGVMVSSSTEGVKRSSLRVGLALRHSEV